jgi:hypothetical protein
VSPADSFERVFSKPEFDVVAAAPSDMPHVELLLDLRAATLPRRLTGEGLADVAKVLCSHDLLTQQEADWLASSGKPWRDNETP